MPKALIEEHGDVAVLRLADGVTNPIGPALVADLDAALTTVEKNFRGMVLAGGEKFFSIGFNLPELIEYDREQMADFFTSFNDLSLRLLTLAMPTVCSISGHAIAGGTILALTTDFRVGASEKKLMGLNEVKLGLPVPYLADLLLRQIVSAPAANRILFTGDFLTTSDAEKIGLADETVPGAEVEARAVERTAAVAALPAGGLRAIKENRSEAAARRYKKRGREKNDHFLDCWFAAASRPLLEEAAKTFSR
jgi:enoyl-CoA hydratase/carnithine racemase